MKKSSSSRLSREELDKLYLVLVYLTLAQSKFNFSLFFFFPLFLLCSEEDAKKSIYSVSTKYYYAFGCKFPEDFAYKIRCNIVTFFHQVYLSLIVVFSLKWRLIKPFIGLQPYQMWNGYCRILICVMVKVAMEVL